MSQRFDKAKPGFRRKRRGFVAAATLLGDRVQKAAEGRGFAVTRLLTHWPEIAGEQLARNTRPVRISHSRGGFGATLTLLTSGPAALMVEMQLPQLRDRVNACYGYNAIQKIILTQTAASGFSEGQAVFAPAPTQAREPDAGERQQAQAVAAQFEDSQLAEAMAQMALNLSSRKKPKG